MAEMAPFLECAPYGESGVLGTTILCVDNRHSSRIILDGDDAPFLWDICTTCLFPRLSETWHEITRKGSVFPNTKGSCSCVSVYRSTVSFISRESLPQQIIQLYRQMNKSFHGGRFVPADYFFENVLLQSLSVNSSECSIIPPIFGSKSAEVQSVFCSSSVSLS